ncbi:hypothetical protein [Flavobacterium psychrotrophum]|uniref:hypothetical protein n=1 Tax=Flavobacterium psychrotrophum TaxID=2294119 RepID=UPI0013C41482|nr:hypothetical protein [Flavobacterium psychrotrophum]
MIHKFLKMLVCTILLFSCTMLHAEDEGPGTGFEDENGDVGDETVESPPTPIDSQIVFLAAAGTALAFFRYRLIRTDK